MAGVAYPGGLNGFIEHVEERRSVRRALADEGLEPLRAVA
jgi:hypothetical protein